eukprot:2318692-Pyramimonas_sp.AAC.1
MAIPVLPLSMQIEAISMPHLIHMGRVFRRVGDCYIVLNCACSAILVGMCVVRCCNNGKLEATAGKSVAKLTFQSQHIAQLVGDDSQ